MPQTFTDHAGEPQGGVMPAIGMNAQGRCKALVHGLTAWPAYHRNLAVSQPATRFSLPNSVAEASSDRPPPQSKALGCVRPRVAVVSKAGPSSTQSLKAVCQPLFPSKLSRQVDCHKCSTACTVHRTRMNQALLRGHVYPSRFSQ